MFMNAVFTDIYRLRSIFVKSIIRKTIEWFIVKLKVGKDKWNI